MPDFIPGIQLSQAFYLEAVRPILDRHFSGLKHSAALVGYGSDVLGYDDVTSTDHLWGPRLVLFLDPGEIDQVQPRLHETLRHELPVRFRGYSTHFGKPDEADGGTRVSEDISSGPIDPLIFYQTLDRFWQAELGPLASPFKDPTPAEWLTFSTQQLLAVTAGKVFHDDLGLEAARRRFTYYPEQVWLYLLAAQWSLIAQQEAFVGRTWATGDELGSRIITAVLVERLIRLCFLMEKRYPPYSKWYGTAFRNLACAPRIGPLLEGALAANTYPERESYLAQAYSLAAELHNALGITGPIDPRTRTYSGWHNLRSDPATPFDFTGSRPYRVIFADRFVDAITSVIQDEQVLALLPGIGAVNQFLVESSNALQSTIFTSRLVDDFKR